MEIFAMEILMIKMLWFLAMLKKISNFYAISEKI